MGGKVITISLVVTISWVNLGYSRGNAYHDAVTDS